MHKLMLTIFLVATLALVASATSRAPANASPPGNAYGVYGCCCPWSVHLGVCPVSPGALLSSFDDVCEIRDANDEFVRYCGEGEVGVYPYRGMTLREIARLFDFRTVADLLGALCGHR